MTHTIHFTPEALQQLYELETNIAAVGSPIIAARYVDSIVDYCENLNTFPHRGTLRDDLRPGLRTLGFRRRVMILFEGASDAVTILGVYDGGQDYEAALRDDEE
ncbi:MAG: type II toxin-antitoxin system RelE/ParE family toxin [Pseudomonadota bacterium]